jgi:hypothetical protein
MCELSLLWLWLVAAAPVVLGLDLLHWENGSDCRQESRAVHPAFNRPAGQEYK